MSLKMQSLSWRHIKEQMSQITTFKGLLGVVGVWIVVISTVLQQKITVLNVTG